MIEKAKVNLGREVTKDSFFLVNQKAWKYGIKGCTR